MEDNKQVDENQHYDYKEWSFDDATGPDIRLTRDRRMVVLMDPPEEPGYRWMFKARLVKVCPNDHDRHYENAYKDDHNFLFFRPPTEEEVKAMILVCGMRT